MDRQFEHVPDNSLRSIEAAVRRIQRKQTLVERLRKRLEQQILIHDAQEAKIQELDAHIRDLNAHKGELNSLILNLNLEIQAGQREIHRLNEEIKAMKASPFWRLRNLLLRQNLLQRFAKRKSSPSPPAVAAPTPVQSLAAVHGEANALTQQDATPALERTHLCGPKVSIIVPNYNHKLYLKQRLDSIFAQTYDNYEVLLLDDCSTDDSRKVLLRYAKAHKDKVRVFFNDENSGSVFAQWQLGIAHATGDLIWIAESDDYCDPDFLEKLVSRFSDESVMLAYAYPRFVDEKGNDLDFTYEVYVADLSQSKWEQSYVETAHKEVSCALGIKNTIPNVSCALFRRISNTLFDYDHLKAFRVCGDWIFYLSIIRGGRIAFVRDTQSYYRFHAKNTSSNYHTDIGFVREHAWVAKHVAANYRVDWYVLERLRLAVKDVWLAEKGDEEAFDRCFRDEAVAAAQALRKPNVLMALFGFTTGGGETVPLGLANKLRRLGYGVTVFDFQPDGDENRTTRPLLDPDIPVIKRGQVEREDLLRDFGIELIHTHHMSVDLYFCARSDKTIPLIVTCHGFYNLMSAEVLKCIEMDVIDGVTHWVYVADRNLEPLAHYRWLHRKIYSKIHNGFEPRRLEGRAVTKADLGLPEDAFIVCLVSRAMGEKGWQEAIDAVEVANLISSRRIALLLVGDGPIYDELIEDEEGDPNVFLLGFRKDVFECFSLSDLGLLPTMFGGESCPMTLIECLTAGKPFVSMNVGEIKNMLTLEDGSQAGAVLDLHEGRVDIWELALVLADIANDSERYEKARVAAKEAARRFSMDLAVSKYEEVYRRVLQSNADAFQHDLQIV
jgi:glycosyltransferase involved in cell wall biosynthesis/outer membrane murein-binding lipoprotein Lpp